MKKCNFCSEREATETIQDPNDLGSMKEWEVCKPCKDFIEESQKKAIKSIMEISLKKAKRKLLNQ